VNTTASIRADDRGALLLLITPDRELRKSVLQLLRQRAVASLPLPVDDPRVLRLQLSGLADPRQLDALRAGLAFVAARDDADLCLLEPREWAPRRRLCVFDMDSTLIDCEVIDELAALAGVGEEVAAVTARAMRGELDFRASLRERMAKLRGLPATKLEELRGALPLMPGAKPLLARLRELGHTTVLLSGGFDYFARELQAQLALDEVHANRLQLQEGVLTGEIDGPVVDGDRKVTLLRDVAARRGFALEDTVAVGDGANDLPMLAEAGLGVAFHAKPLVRDRARHSLRRAPLDALLYLLDVPQPDSCG